MVQLVHDGEQVAGLIEVDSNEIGEMMTFRSTLLSAGKEKWIGVHNGRVGRLGVGVVSIQ